MTERDEIRSFVANLLRQKGDRAPLADSDSLILTGRLESIDAIEIVTFLENRFSLDFANIGFDQNLNDSVDLIVALAQTHAPARRSAANSAS
jgi:acyl carrier protein